MKKLLIMAMAATVLTAPLAQAKDHHHQPPPPPHHSKHYANGWDSHHGPDRHGYYHGYRGYHDHRPGYRRGPDGFWYPAAAFALGAILGSAIAN
jgi:Ni/Co efflux regulator RcnB